MPGGGCLSNQLGKKIKELRERPMTTSTPVTTIAKLFGLTGRRVQQLARDGIIPKPEKNQHELAGSVCSCINYLKQRAFGKGAAQGKYPGDTHLERARLIKAQADMAKIDLAEKTGALVTAGRLEADWMAMVHACCSGLLSIPTKVACQISSLKDPEEIGNFLTRTIRELLTELASDTHDDSEPACREDLQPDDQDGDTGPDAATGIDDEPVSRILEIQRTLCSQLLFLASIFFPAFRLRNKMTFNFIKYGINAVP